MSDFGVNTVGGGLIESVDAEVKGDLKELITSKGEHSASQIVDVTYTFTVKGNGTCPVSAGGSTGAPDGVEGKVIITNATDTQSNEDWEGFSYSGTAFPYA